MGILDTLRQRKTAREARVKTKAYEKARAEGASQQQASEQAEQAVRRARRRRRAAIIGATSGGS